jgi:hypothetical protein
VRAAKGIAYGTPKRRRRRGNSLIKRRHKINAYFLRGRENANRPARPKNVNQYKTGREVAGRRLERDSDDDDAGHISPPAWTQILPVGRVYTAKSLGRQRNFNAAAASSGKCCIVTE